MSAVPVWTCEFLRLGDGPDLNALTVGAKFALDCQGELPVEWTQGQAPKATFAKKEEEYTLQILEAVKLEPQKVQLVVTGYKPGTHNPEYVRVLQGEKGFEILKPQWTVQSVLQPNEQAKPVPPFGPWQLALPLWFWLVIALLLLSIGGLIFRGLRRYRQRKAMLKSLAEHRTVLSPLHQFYKDARELKRKLNMATENEDARELAVRLDHDFRVFVLREFQVPALEWSDAEIARDVRSRHRNAYAFAGDPLKKTLRELRRLKEQDTVLVRDVDQLHRMSLDAAEKLDEGKAQTKGGQR